MARSGRRTAVVERRYIGDSCPNINCLPSKTEIWSAKVAYLVRHAAQFGTMTAPVARSQRGAPRTPPGSGSRWPASSWIIAATSASTSGSRQVRPGSGPSGNAPVAPSCYRLAGLVSPA